MGIALLAGLVVSMLVPAESQPDAIPLTPVHSLAACRSALAGVEQMCDPTIFRQSGHIEIGHADLNGDRQPDLIVRRVSLFNCGSHGCSTTVFFHTRHRYRPADPPLVTSGQVRRCRNGTSAGLRFGDAPQPGPCLLLR